MRRRADRGSVTVIAVGMGLAVVLTGATIAIAASLLVSRAQARNAADLAALAGAAWARSGETVACARASELARRNGAAVVSCSQDGLDVLLAVEVKGVRAVAVAGPVRRTPPRRRVRDQPLSPQVLR